MKLHATTATLTSVSGTNILTTTHSPMQAKFVNRLTMSRKHGAQTCQQCKSIEASTCSVSSCESTEYSRYFVLPEEAEAAAEARARAKAKVKARHPPEPKRPPPRHDRWQRHQRRGHWQERASPGSQYYRGNRRWRNDQWDR